MTSPMSIPEDRTFQEPLSPDGSPRFHGLTLPSPIITRRNRSKSVSERMLEAPVQRGHVKYFSRSRGHGFITPDHGDEDIFVHISDIEGEFIPKAGDEVRFRLCPIPPKMEKAQAVHVQIIHFCPVKHQKWNYSPTKEDVKKEDEERKHAKEEDEHKNGVEEEKNHH